LSKKPEIALLSLGGTIGAPVNSRGGNAALELDAADLLATLPVLGGIATLSPRRFRRMMSADLTADDILQLAAEVQRFFAEFDGVVITQGTDTIEETAFLLDLLIRAPTPVVVTGAMRNPGRPGEDGPANLVAAVRVAASEDSRGLGVVVVLDDTIHLARFVRKSHSFATGSFVSSRAGPVGYVVEDRVRIPLRPRQAAPHFAISPGTKLPPIALATMSLDNDERLLSSVIGAGYRGLVVEAFGAGHVAARIVPLLEELALAMPVVIASRVDAGELFRQSGSYPGSEGDLLARGMISAVGLDGPKARILLMLLVATNAGREAIAAAFEAASQ
jgi:L-asparaginase